MKIDLKLLLVILAVVLLVEFLAAAEPLLRIRSSSSTSRRRSLGSTRRRTSSLSRRRSSSSSSNSSSSTGGSSTVTVVVVVVIVVIVLVIIIISCCGYLIHCRQRGRQPVFEQEEQELEPRDPIFKGPQDGDTGSKTDGETTNESNQQKNSDFDKKGVDAGSLLPYPPEASDQNAAYPQTSFPYPPQEGNYPPDEIKHAPSYPTQSTNSAYPPQGSGEEEPGVPQAIWPGQPREGSTVSAPRIQFESGDDLPPPPSYEDIDTKKKM
ncbi:uncharacterized protein LOC116294187 [Actinia tenebrosa]|uniref:Uncharacterized protein LOC116294187 n=1 Tax=Actinia tenebrosa TaxID=6105 RepID=A0A6P8HY47_ACTTE|nr:uncharacterized protein LOC116294187 [Actinia tenebrosa]